MNEVNEARAISSYEVAARLERKIDILGELISQCKARLEQVSLPIPQGGDKDGDRHPETVPIPAPKMPPYIQRISDQVDRIEYYNDELEKIINAVEF